MPGLGVCFPVTDTVFSCAVVEFTSVKYRKVACREARQHTSVFLVCGGDGRDWGRRIALSSMPTFPEI